ncbi:helix-turn-helix domain-containing protein [Nocardia abscessus]|uniref:helix-turn-helix domain-containing protein n=1 Tax=Nocardia abscessus TaxID=120957 RepID=UPI002458ED07|nr:helix-turn-helix transcriptional regulator [Nocardia abscessus]
MGDRERQTESTSVDAANYAVARHLKAERVRRGLLQADLAEKTGLAINTIRRLESGEREMKFSQLFAIAEALGVSPGAFIDAAQAAMRE